MLRRTTGSDILIIYFNQKSWKEMGCGDGEKKSISIHFFVDMKQHYVKLPLCPHDPRTIPLFTAQVKTGQMSWTQWNYRAEKHLRAPNPPLSRNLWGFSASCLEQSLPCRAWQLPANSPVPRDGSADVNYGLCEGRLQAETLTGQILPQLQGSSRTCLPLPCLVTTGNGWEQLGLKKGEQWEPQIHTNICIITKSCTPTVLGYQSCSSGQFYSYSHINVLSRYHTWKEIRQS